MFASKLALLFFSLVVLVAPGLGDGTVLSGTFVLRNDATLVNASLSGTFYYRYPKNQRTVTDAVVRYEYNVGQIVVSDLYDYKNQSKYSMCPRRCTAEPMKQTPDKWWFVSGDVVSSEKTAPEGFKWYDRPTASANQQLKSICLSTQKDPSSDSSFKIAGIEFFDGRKLTINPTSVKVNGISYTNTKFSTKGYDCPAPTCKTYADLIFVIDNSASLDNREWKQQLDFVKNVQNSFTLGKDATYTSLIAFRGPGSDKCGGKKYSQLCVEKKYIGCGGRTSWRPTNDCYFDRYCRRATNSDKFKVHYPLGTSTTPKDRGDSGNTCQAYGLEEAMRQFDNHRSENSRIPSRIVVAVTDGFDMCPNKTRAAAKKLIEEYDALVIEVGVGLQCKYDEEFLKSIASNLGTPAYVSVNDYGSISSIIDKIVAPVCDQASSSGCSSDCHGFCGCGECFCPDCDTSSDSCFDNVCTEHDGTASGCVLKEDPCSTEEDKCTIWRCDGTKPKDERCLYTNVTCGAENLKKCQSVKCHKVGGCSDVMNNDNMCDNGNKCQEWKCTGQGEDGCQLMKEVKCEDPEKRPCIEASCDPSTGKCVMTDTCKKYANECYDVVCGKEGCEFTMKNEPVIDDCVESANCVNESGWRVVKKTPAFCKDEAEKKGEQTLCMLFECKASEGGCVSSVDERCTADVCTAEILAECKANLTHTASECQTVRCETEKGRAKCVYEMVRCESDGPCTEGFCDLETGTCKRREVENPYKDEAEGNLCYEVFCNKESNKYELRETELNQQCKTDECAVRKCVKDIGCVADTTICQSSNCTTRKCEEGKCVETAVSCPENLCQGSECVEEKGGCVLYDKDPKTVCTEYPSTCYDIKCNPADEKCSYTLKKPPSDDPCTVYTCDNDTGVWTEAAKCDDHIVCTDDRCSYDGKCTNFPTDCLDLSMSGYSCFTAACTERRGCYRKLYANAYVDICGNCIREDGDMGSQSATESADENCLDGMGNNALQPALTTAAVVGIALVAIVVGIALTVSGVFGTKELVKRAQSAQNTSAHSNPLYETDDTEMTNPAFMGDTQ